MMLIQFNDHCIITRPARDEDGNRVYDEWGRPINDEEIYNDACNFQKGGQTALSIITSNDVVYLPSNDVQIDTNDNIEVTTSRGRVLKGVIGNVRDIEMPLSGELYTEIEIKQDKEKNGNSLGTQRKGIQGGA